MCRSIHVLRDHDQPADDDQIRAAALQFVRKVSGYRSPSRVNVEAFEAAVNEVSAVTHRLLHQITETHPARRAS